jgi:hypothetical protein
MTRSYLLITKAKYLPTPFLVEMRVKFGVRIGASFINFYNPFVVWLPQAAAVVIRALLANPRLFHRYHLSVKVGFAKILNENEDALDLGRAAHDAAITAVVEQEAENFAKRRRRTRASEKSYTKLVKMSSKMRKKRWHQEGHLKFSFVEDLRHTMVGFKFAASEMSLDIDEAAVKATDVETNGKPHNSTIN